jgi:hypothetical protein
MSENIFLRLQNNCKTLLIYVLTKKCYPGKSMAGLDTPTSTTASASTIAATATPTATATATSTRTLPRDTATRAASP